MSQLQFVHEVIDPDPPGAHLDITLFADVDGDGKPDVIIGGKQGEANLWWYKNPTWERSVIARTPSLEAGGAILDVNGDGRLDIVAGMEIGGNELYWFENPIDPTGEWPVHLIEDRFNKYHDQLAADIDGDGRPEILMASQKPGVVGYYTIPDDLTRSPWPRECFHQLADDLPNVEGMAVVDLYGDGCLEVLVGPNVFRLNASGGWSRKSFAEDYVMTRLVVADLDGDGRLEIVVSEGESHPGRLSIFRDPDSEPLVLMDDLFHPHSLEVADFDGDGRLDIFVGEMGLGRHANPRMMVLRNVGESAGELRFETVTIQEGIPVHEAKAMDLDGDGMPEIVGKPYHPERHVDIWWNRSGS